MSHSKCVLATQRHVSKTSQKCGLSQTYNLTLLKRSSCPSGLQQLVNSCHSKLPNLFMALGTLRDVQVSTCASQLHHAQASCTSVEQLVSCI